MKCKVGLKYFVCNNMASVCLMAWVTPLCLFLFGGRRHSYLPFPLSEPRNTQPGPKPTKMFQNVSATSRAVLYVLSLGMLGQEV